MKVERMVVPDLDNATAGLAAMIREASVILPSATLIDFVGSGLGAGPATTLPFVTLNLLPWQGQSIVPLAT